MLRQLLGGTSDELHDMSAAQKSLTTPGMEVAWPASGSSSTTLTGTPELFSSTFAMLSDSSLGPYAADTWAAESAPKPAETLYNSSTMTASNDYATTNGNIYSTYDSRLSLPSATTTMQTNHLAYQTPHMHTLGPPPTHAHATAQPFPFRPQPHYFAPSAGPAVGFHPAQHYPIYNQHNQHNQHLPGQPQPHFINNHHRSPHDLQSARLHPAPGPMQPPSRPIAHHPNAQLTTGQNGNPRRPSTVSPSDQASLNSPTLTSSGGSATSETPPLNGEGASSADMDGTEEERVMCMACKGVYPSKRSLTGHIGRSQKCREFTGCEMHEQRMDFVNKLHPSTLCRTYLDQVASGANPAVPGTESAIKAGAIVNGQDGLSPICPHCDRFISHYKGNIRRHINQCIKNGDSPKRIREGKDGKKREYKRRKTEEDVSRELKDGYDPALPPPHSAPILPRMARSLTDVMSSPPLMSPSASYSCDSSPGIHLHQGLHNGQLQSPTSNSNGESPTKSNEPPDDAYICDGCEFVTIYKGNMKRHLNTCHPAPDCKDLKEWDRKLESMKASSQGITKADLIERLNAHKLNSTRGRKPRSRKGTKEEQSDEPHANQHDLATMQMDYSNHESLYGYDHNMGY